MFVSLLALRDASAAGLCYCFLCCYLVVFFLISSVFSFWLFFFGCCRWWLLCVPSYRITYVLCLYYFYRVLSWALC